ncbi:hypothetical protein SJAG_02976 [Schizosaccharomyces japonicus yFS275]|uniref:Uncharacterized protein n=1 Tax=Schizosaccharomyces japonicus (strain yFS275 / FY16936) TaxID=402676 RepID=B6K2Z7_SCHJY|nr:hypothetical protein SJAG_02976 [Schizosaccharomyces japonicus yFS275]EEB07854.1 hypothetical protein SJAG_02976 [Schizosaccharomyces japonicus yFS275]
MQQHRKQQLKEAKMLHATVNAVDLYLSELLEDIRASSDAIKKLDTSENKFENTLSQAIKKTGKNA